MKSKSENLPCLPHEGVKSDLLRAIYLVMLAELPWSFVRAFWEKHPLKAWRSHFANAEFFQLLWEGKRRVPAVYFWTVIQNLEFELNRHGFNSERFFLLVNQGQRGGPPIDFEGEQRSSLPMQPSPVTPINNPVQRVFQSKTAGVGKGALRITRHPPPGQSAGYRFKLKDWLELSVGTKAISPTLDPRGMLLEGIVPYLHRLFPDCWVKELRKMKQGRSESLLFLFHPIARENVPVPDFQLFPGKMLMALPKLWGSPPFDTLDILADSRSPGLLVQGEPWNWKGDILRFGKRPMGRLDRFGTLMNQLKGAEAMQDLAGWPVVSMEKDFVSQNGKRILLRKGCVYGAPFTLAHISYRERRGWGPFFQALSLGKLFHPSQAADASQAPRDMLAFLHREFLAEL